MNKVNACTMVVVHACSWVIVLFCHTRIVMFCSVYSSSFFANKLNVVGIYMPALMTKKEGEKSEKAEASAVAKPKGGKTHDVSVDERDDQPSDELPEWADSKHEAGTKDESAQSSGSSDYESSSDDGKEEERDRQLEKEGEISRSKTRS